MVRSKKQSFLVFILIFSIISALTFISYKMLSYYSPSFNHFVNNTFSNLSQAVVMYKKDYEKETAVAFEKTTADEGAAVINIYDLIKVDEELKDNDVLFRLDVPHISQLDAFPNGCEAVSATMMLNYYGFMVTPDRFIDNYLKMVPVTTDENGNRYGPDPAIAYAGDPRSKDGGWGCYSSVIVRAINDYLINENIYALDVTGISLPFACEKYISSGQPVLLWVTQEYNEVQSFHEWKSYNTNETYRYPKRLHCVVLEGFDESNYYIQDPLKDELIKVDKEQLESSYLSIGCQAVVLTK